MAFGSQQVLNQMEGMDAQQQQATLVRDYYQQQQQQQQQMYQQHLMNQQQQQASFMVRFFDRGVTHLYFCFDWSTGVVGFGISMKNIEEMGIGSSTRSVWIIDWNI